ncbi:MAG: hypothetical protein ABIN89_12660 [Chitinophagaceae bacterium]
MIYKIVLLVLFAGSIYKPLHKKYNDDYINYEPVTLSPTEKLITRQSLDKLHDKYDLKEKMLTKALSGYNYYTDADTGIFHEVRSSFNYAVGLLDLDEEQYKQRAFDIIQKTISLQDTVTASRTCGVWPYYMEEPLATKKSPADFNWADFNGVALLDIHMGHEAKLPADLKAIIRKSLIYAAKSTQKRDVQPGYTNIAIMGTYMTFMTSHLFDLPKMKFYSKNRLEIFYDYTLQRGFTEYNSPTYTITALDDLERMKRHIVDKDARPKIDSLYNFGWSIIAKHFHKPSGQWAGPHSRTYSTLLTSSVNGILKEASGGKINLPGAMPRSDVKIKHPLQAYLLPYFLSPQNAVTLKETLAIDDPKIIGTSYLADKYALSSANRSSLWNQRRPFLAYWGKPQNPSYLQVRFLHDLYDFSSASFYSEQKENNILAAINFSTNGGDKHISIDKLKDGIFKAKDLRLRFEFGNVAPGKLILPVNSDLPFTLQIDGLQFNLQLLRAVFDQFKGHWGKGGDARVPWFDFVFYEGEERDIDLTAINEAVLGFTFQIDDSKKTSDSENPDGKITPATLSTAWKALEIIIPIKPGLQPKNLYGAKSR